MNRIKAKLFTTAFLAILLTFFGGESLAYYQVLGTAENVVTSGNIRFMIHETTDQGTEFPAEGVYVLPGDVVSKRVTIENKCEHPFYLRVKMVSGTNSRELTAEECLKININQEFWELYDGWYYYKGILSPEETTPYVFSQVEIVGEEVDNRYIGSALSLSVRAQALQSENNPTTDGKAYTASGWPQE